MTPQLDLSSILHNLGVEVLRETGDEMLGKCPLHLERTGKEDRHPSWSINTDTYVHHCFSCGYSGTLQSLYMDLVGAVPENLELELRRQSLTAGSEKLSAKLSGETKPVVEGPKVSEWTLRRYDDVPDHLLSRRYLVRAAADLYQIRWDKDRRVWVIPIRSMDGELMGYQFRQKGVELNHPPDMKKSTTLFGGHLFKEERRITVVESPLDAVRLMSVGIPSVSTMGASLSDTQVDILCRNYSIIVAAMDNDPPGHKATNYLLTVARRRGTLVLPLDYSGLPGKDPGDVADDEQLKEAWVRSVALNVKETP